jgi:hypothetical protein
LSAVAGQRSNRALAPSGRLACTRPDVLGVERAKPRTCTLYALRRSRRRTPSPRRRGARRRPGRAAPTGAASGGP